MNTRIFTSIARNYLPKAAVLATSLKRLHPEVKLSVIQVDAHLEPSPHPLWAEFDEVLTLSDLSPPIEDFDSWVFRHNIVELCTAVKGFGFQHFLRKKKEDKVIYLDPDIMVMSSLGSVLKALDESSVLLTPHLTKPELTREGQAYHECGALRNGVFNLGFMAVRNSKAGHALVDWWTERLVEFCYADVGSGMFTDQKWMDFVPVLFDDYRILKDPGLNVAAWNLGQRAFTRNKAGKILVDGVPIKFFHFSGFESGAHAYAVEKFAGGSKLLKELTSTYRGFTEFFDQAKWMAEGTPLDRYSNGERITAHQRTLYRKRADLLRAFPEPRQVTIGEPCYLHWYKEDLRKALLGKLEGLAAGSTREVFADVESFLRLS